MTKARNCKKFEVLRSRTSRKLQKRMNGCVMYRIRALVDTKWAKKGDFGGWVESEDCLSQTGDAWISGEAAVFKGAVVEGDALVSDDTQVYDSRISGNAQISGCARVRQSEVSGNAKVFGNAAVWRSHIYGNAEVYENANLSCVNICDDAHIFGKAHLEDDVNVFGRARVFGNAIVCRGVSIYESAEVSGFACINRFDSHRIGQPRHMWDPASKSIPAYFGYTVQIHGKAKISGCACIWAGAEIFGNADISGNVWIEEGAKVFGNAKLQGSALIGKKASISRNSHYLVLEFGEYKKDIRHQDVLTFFRNSDGELSLTHYDRNDRDCAYSIPQKEFGRFLKRMADEAKFYTHGNKLNVYKKAVELAQLTVDTSI